MTMNGNSSSFTPQDGFLRYLRDAFVLMGHHRRSQGTLQASVLTDMSALQNSLANMVYEETLLRRLSSTFKSARVIGASAYIASEARVTWRQRTLR